MEMEAHTTEVSSDKEVDDHTTDLMKKKYICTCCKYESSRHFNVARHEKRIHRIYKPQKCCGDTFLTKGEYYQHCEEFHPERRRHSKTSKLKYKIGCNYEPKEPAIPTHTKKPAPRIFEYSLRSRCSERIYAKRGEGLKTKIRFKYSINYSEHHLENIPLIYFLTDSGLRRYLKKKDESYPENDGREINHLDTPIEISDTPPYVQAEKVEERENNNKCTSISEPQTHSVNDHSNTPIRFKLPVKKSILQRFTTKTKIEFGSVIIRQKNSITNRTVLTENRMKTSENRIKSSEKISTVFKTGQKIERCGQIVRPWLDKENEQPCLNDESERYVQIRLDKSIASPLVMQQHREYLDLIDFDHYKIF